ncbi:ribonuclease HI family protein [Candidatus Peribacteria bacterium]|nr:ribonuclease HI family protein [Candidatus Peribacteria bacterium]
MDLPSSLERRLQKAFPRESERERFVVDTLEEALAQSSEGESLPEGIGGTLHLFTDGGSRGNPGQAGIGCVLVDPSQGITLKEHAECIGIETNNVAEYRALIAGLQMALAYQPNRLICHLDSELVVKQLNGEYRVKMSTLQPLVDQIKELAMQFPDVVFQHIPREDNWRADELVNKALDANPISHKGLNH